MRRAVWGCIVLSLALAVVCAAATTAAGSAETAARPQPRRVLLSFDGPVEVDMPVWGRVKYVDSDRNVESDIRYPFNRTPWYLGEYEFDVKREDKALATVVPKRPVVADMSNPGWSAAPLTSPKARLPLHLQYRLDQPGTYQVRLCLTVRTLERSQAAVPVSDWTALEVKAAAPAERRAWLEKMKGNVPEDVGLLVGDFLPSILACPDDEVLSILRQVMCHPDPFVQAFALNGLSYYDDEIIGRELIELVRSAGPTRLLAYVLSWQRDLLQPAGPQLVAVMLDYLKSDSAVQVGGAVRALGFLKAHYTWDRQPDVPDRIEAEVFKNVSHIRQFKEREALHPLCLFLGSAKTQPDRAREMLWELSEDATVREQALICIGWRKDARDLANLGGELLKNDPSARPLPYQMRRGYGKDAIPYLLKGIQDAPNDAVRYECAKELTLENRPEGFAFLAKCIRAGGRYRRRAIQDVRDHFRDENLISEEQILRLLDTKGGSATTRDAPSSL